MRSTTATTHTRSASSPTGTYPLQLPIPYRYLSFTVAYPLQLLTPCSCLSYSFQLLTPVNNNMDRKPGKGQY